MRINRRSIGYGAYEGVFEPNFKICKSEGGTFTCPSEYVQEFSGIDDIKRNLAKNPWRGAGLGATLGLLATFVSLSKKNDSVDMNKFLTEKKYASERITLMISAFVGGCIGYKISRSIELPPAPTSGLGV